MHHDAQREEHLDDRVRVRARVRVRVRVRHRVKEDVGRLEVAMDDALAVQVLQPGEDLR